VNANHRRHGQESTTDGSLSARKEELSDPIDRSRAAFLSLAREPSTGSRPALFVTFAATVRATIGRIDDEKPDATP
jgi:hypothetical protein